MRLRRALVACPLDSGVRTGTPGIGLVAIAVRCANALGRPGLHARADARPRRALPRRAGPDGRGTRRRSERDGARADTARPLSFPGRVGPAVAAASCVEGERVYVGRAVFDVRAQKRHLIMKRGARWSLLVAHSIVTYHRSVKDRLRSPLRRAVVGIGAQIVRDNKGRGRADESRHTSLRKYAFDANDAELTEVARDANNLHRVGKKSDPNRVSAHDSSR